MKTQHVLTLAAIAALGVTLVPAANAQSTGLVPVRVKVGIYQPRADDVAGDHNFLGEVDVQLPKSGGGKTFVSAGYTSGSNNGESLRVVPVTVGQYFSPPNPVSGATGNVYAGVGAGPYFVRARNDGDTENKVAIGAFGVVGYQFPNKFFIEAKYHVVNKVNGVSPGGLALAIGKSF